STCQCSWSKATGQGGSSCIVEVRDVHVPVLMGPQRLHEALALEGGADVMPLQEPGRLEDAVDAGGAAGDDVPVEHHKGQPPIALERVLLVEVDDGLLLGVRQPV